MDLSEQLRDINTQLTAIIRNIGANHGITFSQANILLAIPVDGLFSSQLAQKVGIEVSTATRNLKKLESLGYINREKNHHDRRKISILLTRDGEELVERLDLELDNVTFSLQQMMSIDEREAMTPVLESLTWNLIRYRAEKGVNE